MLYKDACNAKSNQKNLETIRSSNLCTEIVQYSLVEYCTRFKFEHQKFKSIALEFLRSRSLRSVSRLEFLLPF